MYVSPTQSVYLHVLHRVPWRYLYLPGLYCLAFGISTLAVAIKFGRVQHNPGWSIYLADRFVIFLIGPVLHGTPAFFMGWYMLKDSHFANPHDIKPNYDDTSREIERVLRVMVQYVPWDYAYIPGMAMFVLSFAIIAYAMFVHQTGADATDWGTAISLRLCLVFAIVLNMGGLAFCMAWHLFRGLEVDGVAEIQQGIDPGSNSEDGNAEDKCLPSNEY